MLEKGKNWSCPYCGHAQVITEDRFASHLKDLDVKNWEKGRPAYYLEAAACANNDCRQLIVNFTLGIADWTSNYLRMKERVEFYKLLPKSHAKPYPSYIPEPLRRDYEEACAIKDLSPKASATLIRRCIQGIIRDFCNMKLKDNRLVKEIEELRRLVDEGRAPLGVQIDTVEAIDAVRKVGNIGAHMEADINLIVDVDPEEAQTLIQLAELLFDEWYVQREKRKLSINRIHAINAAKNAQKKSGTNAD